MTDSTQGKGKRLAQAASDLNVSRHTVIEYLKSEKIEIEDKPTTKLTDEMWELLLKKFQKDAKEKEKAEKISLGLTKRENVEIKGVGGITPKPVHKQEEQDELMVKTPGVMGKLSLGGIKKTAPKVETPPPPPPPEPEPPKEEIIPVSEPEEILIEEKTDTPVVEPISEKPQEEEVVTQSKPKLPGTTVVGKINLGEKRKPKSQPEEEVPVSKAEPEIQAQLEEIPQAPTVEERKREEIGQEATKDDPEFITRKKITLDGPKIIGKMDLPSKQEKPKEQKAEENTAEKKRKRKKIVKTTRTDTPTADKKPADRPGQQRPQQQDNQRKRPRVEKETEVKTEVSEKEIEEKIKRTQEAIRGATKGKSIRSKIRKTRRKDSQELEEHLSDGETKTLQVTEFVSVNELASLMNVTAIEVIQKCMELGVIVSINQRLDADIITLVGGEFDFDVKFINVADQDEPEIEEPDAPESLVERPPIVTIMGHVDHGKTSLLDYIRTANVVAGEVGGITQHIGAYEVTTEQGKRIAFLDTPGHEAFTAMRARGAKVTDIAVIVVAADDSVMPQTREAISHAQAAGVPMIFAINKIDKEGANSEKIKEQLANMNLLVEDWGGKYQCQEISAKKGLNIDLLLEKILLEAELLELKANPNKFAIGSIIEASLDKGRGYVANILVQEGTLKIGDVVVSGVHYGKVKALFNERGQKIKEAGPSTPCLLLGLNGAPQAGESFKVYENEQDAKTAAGKKEQIVRELGLRTKKHITLDEIGRRLALGTFQELNVIIKGDVDGSVEALTDSLEKLSTDEIKVRVVMKAVGQITESDVLLASASDAIIVGFQVRPSVSARKLAEKENIDIRLYSIIYKAIEEIRDAMEGMLQPKIEEKITANIEIREVFKITKVGTVAGCYVLDGKVNRNSRIRLIRDGIVTYTGELASLKRFKDDVKEVGAGMECGLNIKNFNDIKVGDIIECFEEVEIKRSL